MKKVFILSAFFSLSLFAQTEQKSVELPDFVITGRQNVEVYTAAKRKPDLISIVSQDFLTPRYSPEELPLLISAEPKSILPSIDDLNNSFFGNLKVGIGRFTYPIGELNLNKSLDFYLLHANIWGSNIKDYISNAGYNASGFSVDNNIFVSTKSDILPGSIIKLDGNYFRDSYKFYGSSKPDSLRETNRRLINFSFSNTYNKWFNFGLDLRAQFLTIEKINLKEKKLEGSGFFETKFNKITFGGKGIFQKQFLDNNLSGKGDYNFYSAEGFTKIYSFQNIVLILGAGYSKNYNNSFFFPFGSLEMKIANGFTFKGEFHPQAKYYTIIDFINKNRFMVNDSLDNLFTKENINISGSVKYEYEKYFTINLWGSYNRIKNYLYFEDILQNGFFNVLSSSQVKSFTAGVDFILYSDDYGYLNCQLKTQRVKDLNERYIPYIPLYNAAATYGYSFQFGLEVKASYKFAKDIYADINNKRPILDYHDLSLSFSYNVFNSLTLRADFQNILNRSNFVLDRYKEKLFDVIFGVEYRWQ